MRRFLLITLGIVLALVVIGIVAREPMQREMMRRTLATGPNGPETPQSVGVPFERVQIASNGNKLDGYLVLADAQCDDAPIILIFHGLGETISRWVMAQRVLHGSCVSSLVFDYTGTGNSTGDPSFDAVNDDIRAAYQFVRTRLPGARTYLLGHSMGNAPMLTATPELIPAPSGVIVGNAFSTLRASMDRAGLQWLSWSVPDGAWDNLGAINKVHVPVLIVVGDADKVNPPAESQALFRAANDPKVIVELPNLSHNALYRDQNGAWWQPVLRFTEAGAPATAQTQ